MIQSQAQLGSIEASQTSSQEARELAIQEAERAAALARKHAAQERANRAKSWNEEEVRMLQKALVKFPQGTARRWEQVAAYVRTRTVDEVMEMVKVGLKTGKLAQKGGINVAKKRQVHSLNFLLISWFESLKMSGFHHRILPKTLRR